jgi:dTDP-4-dehydrorhamnose reductase
VKILITGSDGQLGTDLCIALKKHELVPLTIGDGDIADLAFIKARALKHRPDVIINTASFVRVDDCEDQRELAFRVNSLGARNAALAAQEIKAKLVHISTDYVFGGEAVPRSTPYLEEDKPSPCNVYGASKQEGDGHVRRICRNHVIVRSSALFGTAGAMGKGGNFVETIIKLAKERPELRVVNDQVFSPTYTHDLAAKIAQIIEIEFSGIIHVTNSGACSWYEFTVEILKQAGLKTPVVPITSAQFPQKAKRPRYSVLGHGALQRLGLDDLPPWQEALADYLKLKGPIQ